MLIPDKVALFLSPVASNDEEELQYTLLACVFIGAEVSSEEDLQALLCDTTKALEATYDMESVVITVKDSSTLISLESC